MPLQSNEIVSRALEFAYTTHAGQARKYTGDPYIIHPIAVAAIVASVSDDPSMIAAALLHDAVEDTDATLEDIQMQFGDNIASLVSDLTDVSKLSDGNRAIRKAIDLEHTSKASPKAKTIKLADFINNSESIVEHDPNFAVYYMKEKKALLEVLKEGDATLWNRASKIVNDYFDKIGEK